jgi:hypothetical protein
MLYLHIIFLYSSFRPFNLSTLLYILPFEPFLQLLAWLSVSLARGGGFSLHPLISGLVKPNPAAATMVIISV